MDSRDESSRPDPEGGAGDLALGLRPEDSQIRRRRRAAWVGALAAGAPVALMTLCAFQLVPWALPPLLTWLFELAPVWLAAVGVPLVGLGVLALPAMLGLPLGLVVSRMVGEAARKDPDGATAMAAGAGMGAALAGFGTLLAHADLYHRSTDAGPLAVSIALGVGSVGALAFCGLPADPRTGRRTPVPAAYAGLLAAGVNGPALLGAGVLGSMVAGVLPWNPMTWLMHSLGWPLGPFVAASLSVMLLAPVSYVVTRKLRRHAPGTSPAALTLGALSVTTLPVVAASRFLFQDAALYPVLPYLVGVALLLVLGTHGLAAYLATGAGALGRRSLPDGSGQFPKRRWSDHS